MTNLCLSGGLVARLVVKGGGGGLGILTHFSIRSVSSRAVQAATDGQRYVEMTFNGFLLQSKRPNAQGNHLNGFLLLDFPILFGCFQLKLCTKLLRLKKNRRKKAKN